MKRFPRWYVVSASSCLILWLVVSLYYALGASGVKAFGATTSFDRSHDFSLFKIDEQRAFRVDKYGTSLTKYKRGSFPFCPLCGINESAGTIMNLAVYRKGRCNLCQCGQCT